MSRSYIKDFLAGVDPTGTDTFKYGLKDAPRIKRQQSTRRTIGTVGGLIGGGLVIPSAVGGLIGAAKGAGGGLKGVARGFVSGAAAPVTKVISAVRLQRFLGKLERGKGITQPELKKAVRATTHLFPDVRQAITLGKRVVNKGKQSTNFVASALKNSDGISAEQALRAIPKETAGEARKYIRTQLSAGLGGLGVSGLVGAGSAHLQYGKGGRVGKLMTPEQRRKV